MDERLRILRRRAQTGDREALEALERAVTRVPPVIADLTWVSWWPAGHSAPLHAIKDERHAWCGTPVPPGVPLRTATLDEPLISERCRRCWVCVPLRVYEYQTLRVSASDMGLVLAAIQARHEPSDPSSPDPRIPWGNECQLAHWARENVKVANDRAPIPGFVIRTGEKSTVIRAGRFRRLYRYTGWDTRWAQDPCPSGANGEHRWWCRSRRPHGCPVLLMIAGWWECRNCRLVVDAFPGEDPC